jgi:hypothetical protein
MTELADSMKLPQYVVLNQKAMPEVLLPMALIISFAHLRLFP